MAPTRHERMHSTLSKTIHDFHNNPKDSDSREYVKACVAKCSLEFHVESIDGAQTHTAALDFVRGEALSNYREANTLEYKTDGVFRQLIGIVLSIGLFILGISIRGLISNSTDQTQTIGILVGCTLMGILVGWLVRHLYSPIRIRIRDRIFRLGRSMMGRNKNSDPKSLK